MQHFLLIGRDEIRHISIVYKEQYQAAVFHKDLISVYIKENYYGLPFYDYLPVLVTAHLEENIKQFLVQLVTPGYYSFDTKICCTINTQFYNIRIVGGLNQLCLMIR